MVLLMPPQVVREFDKNCMKPLLGYTHTHRIFACCVSHRFNFGTVSSSLTLPSHLSPPRSSLLHLSFSNLIFNISLPMWPYHRSKAISPLCFLLYSISLSRPLVLHLVLHSRDAVIPYLNIMKSF